LFVYQQSKLWFFKFILTLFEFLEPDSFTLAYLDTDSILIGMTADSLDDLVLPEKKDEWITTTKKIWFADSSPRGQKTPGFLKEEFSSTDGKYIGLRYWVHKILICYYYVICITTPKFILNLT